MLFLAFSLFFPSWEIHLKLKHYKKLEYLLPPFLSSPSQSEKKQATTTAKPTWPPKPLPLSPPTEAMSNSYCDHSALLEKLYQPNIGPCTFWNPKSSHMPIYSSFFQLERSTCTDFMRLFIDELKASAYFFPLLNKFDFASAADPVEFLDAHPKLAFIYLFLYVPGSYHELSQELKKYLFGDFLDDPLEFRKFARYREFTKHQTSHLEVVRLCFTKVLRDAQMFANPKNMSKEDIEIFCRAHNAQHLFHQLCHMLQRHHFADQLKQMIEEVDEFLKSV